MRLAPQVLAEEPYCACGAPSQVAGHIVPYAYGGQTVRENLTGQCQPCNLKQISRDRRIYMRDGCGDA